MPTGTITPGTSSLPAIEAPHRRIAPHSADAGSRCRWFSPTSMRAACGPTSPTNPIEPAMATAVAATTDTPTSTHILVRSTDTPSARARSSPSRSAVSVQAERRNRGVIAQ
jgi:hypothetical protein